MDHNKTTANRTVMDRIFDFPLVYRIKITLIKVFLRPISLLLIRNKFSEEDVILRNIPSGSRVYEIGCGDGNGLRLFKGANLNVDYTASDYNTHMVDYCRQHYPEANFEYYSGGPYPHEDQSFDFVVIRHVLHHIPNRDDIVLTVRESLRIGKTLVLIEPLQSDGKLLAAIKSIYWRITDGGVNYMTLDELHQVWKDAGASVTWEVWTQPLHQAYACTMVRQSLSA